MGGNEQPDLADGGFTLSDLDYSLPEALIAQHPLPRREDSRLLVVDRGERHRGGRVDAEIAGSRPDSLHDQRITDCPSLLSSGDLMVLNDTKVLPAKFTARRRTGGRVRGLFLDEESHGQWRVMLEGSRRLRLDESLEFIRGGEAAGTLRLLHEYGNGEWRVGVDRGGTAEQVLEQIGQMPLPPYIRRDDRDPQSDPEDRLRYQTVYARQSGAIAAPTAGLHLTEPLLDRIRAAGVEIAYVTLHVGAGTFKPIAVEEIARHHMHSERYELSPETVKAVQECRNRGGRVVAVGTTTVRVLESAAERGDDRLVRAGSGATDLFIYPPCRFQVVDALLTNFHLPRSTLLALVMAFAGIFTIQRAYKHAIDQGYRFYSFGDAMLVV